jgi:hypothetical protein
MWLCKIRFAVFELPKRNRAAIVLIGSVVSRRSRAAISSLVASPLRPFRFLILRLFAI